MSPTGRLLKTIILAALVFGFTGISSAHANTIIKWACRGEQQPVICAEEGRIDYIFIYGEIDEETAITLAEIDGWFPIGRPFPPIYINSVGGRLDAAVWIGRILRRRGATIEGRDVLVPDSDASCASACVLIAAGAVVRQFRDIGLHRSSTVRRDEHGKLEVMAGSEATLKYMFKYLDEMGIPPAIRPYIASTSYEDMTYLTYDGKKPREQQPIVALGFRMLPDDPKLEPKRASGVLTLADDLVERYAAADTGDVRAARELADLLFYGSADGPKNVAEALRYYELAADFGDLKARDRLGLIFKNGQGGVPVDNVRAVKHFLTAAQAGYAKSQNNLAFAYFKGAGVEKNIPEAVYWATRSAEQGEALAYSTLGEMRFAGAGFPVDDIETFKWLRLAATKMPGGSRRKYVAELSAVVMERMSRPDYLESLRLIAAWKPAKPKSRLLEAKDEDD